MAKIKTIKAAAPTIKMRWALGDKFSYCSRKFFFYVVYGQVSHLPFAQYAGDSQMQDNDFC